MMLQEAPLNQTGDSNSSSQGHLSPQKINLEDSEDRTSPRV